MGRPSCSSRPALTVPMHTEVDGEGFPVLMLHGAGVSGWLWGPVRKALPSTVKMIVPDLPGFGRSADRAYVSHRRTVRELSDVLHDHAPQGAHVVGFSLGAQLAVLLAAELPHLVRGVVVISAETKPLPLPGPTLALLAVSAPLARRRRFAVAQARQLGIPEHLMEQYLRDSVATSRSTLLSSVGENIRFGLPVGWSTYPGQAAVMVGAGERTLMHDFALLTTSALPASTLHTVEGAAHDIPLSHPDVVASVVRRQIREWVP
ncbi:hydrolase [Arthrobacter sp. RIT-PI-e]|nr:hydrolase [Arthrobacter sp. RIT-PI-e]